MSPSVLKNRSEGIEQQVGHEERDHARKREEREQRADEQRHPVQGGLTTALYIPTA